MKAIDRVSAMRLDSLPSATQDLLNYAQSCAELQAFTLIGGTALALQVGHRQSLDLDFAVFAEKLPLPSINRWLARLRENEIAVQNITSQSEASAFRINTGEDLKHYAQDYVVAGVKVTFFAHGKNDSQLRYYQSAARMALTECNFSILGIEGLKVSKTLVLADRVRSRDIFDLHWLYRHCGLSIEDIVETIESLGHNNNIDHYFAILQGHTPLDKQDEGLQATGAQTTIEEMYHDFDGEITRWQQSKAAALFSAPPP
jgi:hypothetical protein